MVEGSQVGKQSCVWQDEGGGVDPAGELGDDSSCSAPESFRGSSTFLGEKNVG